LSFFGNISRFESFKAGLNGIAATVRKDAEDAQTAVVAARNLTAEVGRLLVTITTEAGRWHQESARDLLKQKIIDKLRGAGPHHLSVSAMGC
jgi:hypothetical protein